MYQSAKKLEVEIYNTKRNLIDAKCQLIVSTANLEGYQQQLAEAQKAVYTEDTSPVHRFLWLKSKSVSQLAKERQSSLRELIFYTESKISDQHFFILRLEVKIEHLTKYKGSLDTTSRNCKRSTERVAKDELLVLRGSQSQVPQPS